MNKRQRSEIEALLEEIEQTRRRIYVSKAYGVRRAGLRDLKADVAAAQRRLATLH